jgi:hypothetical protein
MSKDGWFKKTDTNKDELGFQKKLLDAVDLEGGYGRKVAHPQLKGISDLLIQLHGFSMVQVECKDLGVMSPDFDIKNPVTEHQRKHICKLNSAARGYVAFYCYRAVINNVESCVFSTSRQKRITGADFAMTPFQMFTPWSGFLNMWSKLGVLRTYVQGREI